MLQSKRYIPNRKLSKQNFVERANKKHNNKFTYPDDYIGGHTKIRIICPTHGEFFQTPSSHMSGIGCPACSGNKRPTTEEVIEEAKNIWGDRYGLDKIVYTKNGIPFEVTCPVHGSFFKTRAEFILNKSGCNKCSRREIDTDLFLQLAKDKHGERYNYDKTKYVKSNLKIIITCKEHGDFEMRPNNHLNGQGCPSCGGKDEITIEDIKKRNHDKYGNRYDVLSDTYVNAETKLTFRCNKHDRIFHANIYHHLKAHACVDCLKEHIASVTANNVHSFIERAKVIHNNKYDYSMVNYTGNKTPVHIKCKKHGSFYQRPDAHIVGRGCSVCNASKGELKIFHYLTNKKVKFIREYSIDKSKYRYDFYLPDYNLLIEYHGGQHYFPVEFWGGEEGLWERRFADRCKRSLARRNGYSMLTIPYTKFINIIHILNKKLKIK